MLLVIVLVLFKRPELNVLSKRINDVEPGSIFGLHVLLKRDQVRRVSQAKGFLDQLSHARDVVERAPGGAREVVGFGRDVVETLLDEHRANLRRKAAAGGSDRRFTRDKLVDLGVRELFVSIERSSMWRRS